MRHLSSHIVTRPDSSTLLGFFMALMLVFLQEGFTYYLSFQTLALLLVVVLIFTSRPSLVNARQFLLVFLVLSFFVGVAGAYSPMVVSRNASNIFFTIVGILAYALMIISFLSITPKRVGLILYTLKYASLTTILVLAALLVLTDLSLLPFLNRDALFMQNGRLVTNYAGEEVLMNELAYRSVSDLSPRVDLFYGEPSYLGIVIFTCVVCYILTSRLISDFHRGSGPSFSSDKYQRYVVMMGVISLLFLQSLSSIMYAMLILFFEFRGAVSRGLSITKLIALIVFFALFALLFRDSIEYALYRITMQDSISTLQRFGSLLEFGISDYLFGLRDEARIPDEGFHNGLFYIIAISGGGGILYVTYMLRAVHRLAKPIGMSAFLILVVLALIMQNGAVFSPNKVVLFALILLPLSCVRAIYPRKKFNLYREVVK